MNYSTDNNNDLDIDLEFAYELCIKDYTHDELIKMLQKGSIAEKQIAALSFDNINNENDVNALLSNLTGCDGKIREAVAFKINSILLDNDVKQLFAPICANVFADATIDINANICRLIVDSAILLKKYDVFAINYTQHIVHFIEEALSELDKFIFKDKKYVINKQLFKLYWCLEALNNFIEYVNPNELSKLLNKCMEQSEYTIKEKVAAIINKHNIEPALKDKLYNDENYYVKQILHHPSVF